MKEEEGREVGGLRGSKQREGKGRRKEVGIVNISMMNTVVRLVP